jgi:hypothetical protein
MKDASARSLNESLCLSGLCGGIVSPDIDPLFPLFNFYSQTDNPALCFQPSVAAAEPVKNNSYPRASVCLVFAGNKDITGAVARENL